MEEETMENSTSSSSSMYYVLGAIVLVAVIGAGYMLRPKTDTSTSAPVAMTPAPTPTPGPITRLACDTQYYNPVLGFPKYYLSAQGGDVTGATKVDCAMTMIQENKVVATQTITSPLTANPARGGSEFKCTTPGVELKPTVPTKVDVVLTDDQGAKATCSASFSLPKS
ncbi:MAG TPA: hypothetical protein VMR81_05740 [Patescibacteria group bacterium]|jgi:hypothetical protein|nr:hypothetical protein [Patescibacteria group bacterium]